MCSINDAVLQSHVASACGHFLLKQKIKTGKHATKKENRAQTSQKMATVWITRHSKEKKNRRTHLIQQV